MQEKIEHNLRATAIAFEALKKAYFKGCDTHTLLDAFIKSLDETLGEYRVLYDYLIGEETARIDGTSANRVLRDGDVILLDVSVGKDGVWSDVCRTFFVGEATEKQRESFELVKRSLRSGETALKAGVTAEEIYAAANGVYAQVGKELVHHAGHRIGGEPLLQPQFLRGNRAQIQSGNFVTVETGLYEDFGIRLENDYLITDSGAENLFEGFLPLNIEEYVLKK